MPEVIGLQQMEPPFAVKQVAVATGFYKDANPEKRQSQQKNVVRDGWSPEDERGHAGGEQDCPIAGRVQPAAPDGHRFTNPRCGLELYDTCPLSIQPIGQPT